MSFNRARRDGQCVGDFAVGQAVGEHGQHVVLARAQRQQVALRCRQWPAAFGCFHEVAQGSCREPPRHGQFAARRPAQGAQQRLRAEVLGQVAGGALTDRLDQVALRAGHRQHDDACHGQPRRQLLHELDAIHAGQVNVEQQDVRLQNGREGQRFGCRSRLADQFDVGGGNGLADGRPDQGVVVDEHHPQRTDLLFHGADPTPAGRRWAMPA